MIGKSEQGRFNRIQQAKAECAMCPVREDCLDWAIETNQDFGIWGGCTERERRKIRNERNRRG
jgi:WhiB family redox-sensing transcriptional regulator